MMPRFSLRRIVTNAVEMALLYIGIYVLTGHDSDRTLIIYAVLISAGAVMSMAMQYRFRNDIHAIATSLHGPLERAVIRWGLASIGVEVGALLLVAPPHFALAYILFRVPFLLISAKIPDFRRR